MPLVKFNKDYKGFKKGQHLELPDKRFSGQVQLAIWWGELKTMIKKGIVDLQEK